MKHKSHQKTQISAWLRGGVQQELVWQQALSFETETVIILQKTRTWYSYRFELPMNPDYVFVKGLQIKVETQNKTKQQQLLLTC